MNTTIHMTAYETETAFDIASDLVTSAKKSSAYQIKRWRDLIAHCSGETSDQWPIRVGKNALRSACFAVLESAAVGCFDDLQDSRTAVKNLFTQSLKSALHGTEYEPWTWRAGLDTIANPDKKGTGGDMRITSLPRLEREENLKERRAALYRIAWCSGVEGAKKRLDPLDPLAPPHSEPIAESSNVPTDVPESAPEVTPSVTYTPDAIKELISQERAKARAEIGRLIGEHQKDWETLKLARAEISRILGEHQRDWLELKAARAELESLRRAKRSTRKAKA